MLSDDCIKECHMSLFAGLSAFPLTPTDLKGRLKPDVLEKHLERIVSAKPASIGLLGSTGSYAYLTLEERRRTVRVAAQILRGRTALIVGIGTLRTDQTVELGKDAANEGADGLLLAPVSYQKLTDDEVYRHFETVAAAVSLPVCIYNNPSTTNFTFGHALIERLSKLPNILAIKMPLPADGDFADELLAIRTVTADGFSVGYSGDWGAKDALLAGADSWFSVIAGLLPDAAVQLTRAAMKGDALEANRLHQALEPIWLLFKEFGSFRVMYAVASLLDNDGIEPPHPVQPLAQNATERVRTALEATLSKLQKA
jgi:4-hydroxy-tetrahydrodipicolinate synthase